MAVEDYVVDLKEPNIAIVSNGSTNVQGVWSIMYDQGIFVETDAFRFIVNFKYTVKPEFFDKVDKLSTSSYEAFDSLCNETMVGFVQHKKESSTMSCFYGLK